MNKELLEKALMAHHRANQADGNGRCIEAILRVAITACIEFCNESAAYYHDWPNAPAEIKFGEALARSLAEKMGELIEREGGGRG